MAEQKVESASLKEYVRVSEGANGDRISVLDPAREGYRDMTLSLGVHGITLTRKSGYSSLVPWAVVREVIFAMPEKAAEKAK